jgi:hypothetical protein
MVSEASAWLAFLPLLLAAFSHGGDLFGNARERRVPLHPVNGNSIARKRFPVNTFSFHENRA